MTRLAGAWRVVAAGAMCAAGIAGCNIIGPAMVIIKGPPKVDAVHTLERDKPTVVFVDDRANHLPRRSMRQTIASTAGNTLLEEKVLTRVIEPRAVLAATTGEIAGEPMDLVTLGRNVLADVVIYATIDRYALSGDAQTFSPMVQLRVKVIDVTGEGGRVWPEDKMGHPVVVTLPQSASPPATSAELQKTEEKLGQEVGRAIAELFFEHLARRPMNER